MKIKEIVVTNTYTCSICNKWFDSKEEMIQYPPYFLTICSNKCKQNFIFNLLKKMNYSNKELQLLLKSIGKEYKILDFRFNFELLRLAKFYNISKLTTIKVIGQVDKT